MEKSCDVSLVTFFGDVITIASLKQRTFYNFNFVIISLKTTIRQITQFQVAKIEAWRFLKICLA